MNFLNQFGKQLTELFESMTPAARVTGALLLAVVVVSLGFLFQQTSGKADEYLFGGEPLSGAEINAMTAAMSKAGLNGFEVQGAHIRVPRANRDEYIAAVYAEDAQPKGADDYMSEALTGSSPFASREEKLQRFKLANERRFSHIIGWFPEVHRASVIYEVKSVRGPRPTEVASATVSVVPKPGQTIGSRRKRGIQKLVAGAFTSMSPDDVEVNNMGGDEALAGVGGLQDPGQHESIFHRERVRIENQTYLKIMRHLKHIPGVQVQVSAILDETLQTTRLERKPDPQSVAKVEETDESSNNETTTDNVGRPGVTAFGPRGAGAEDAPERQTTRGTTRTKTITTSEIGDSTTQTVVAGMTAKEIQASVEIPRSYVVDVWRQTQLLLTGSVPDQMDAAAMQRAETDVIDKVTAAVKPLLPKLQRDSDYDQVNVVVIDTPTPLDLPEPSLVNEAMAWTTGNASTLGMLGVAVFGLLMLRSMVKPAPEGDPTSPVLQLDGENVLTRPAGGGDALEDDDDERPKLKLRKAESLTDDLSELVREDPEAAAAILRGWIGNAG